MNSTAPQTWTGWFRLRKGHPWEPLAQGESDAEAFRALRRVTASQGLSGDLLILESGRHPDDRGPRTRGEAK